MRLFLALWLMLVPVVGAQAQFVPRSPPSGDRLPGIMDHGSRPTDPPIGRDLRDSRTRIDRARDSGALSKREARTLRREVRQIGTLADRYGQDGLSDSERREIDTRIRVLQSATEAQRLRGSGKRP